MDEKLSSGVGKSFRKHGYGREECGRAITREREIFIFLVLLFLMRKTNGTDPDERTDCRYR